jgi:glucokinase
VAPRCIGVDVGGTKIAVTVLADGAFGDVVVRPTDRSSTEALLTQLAGMIVAAADGDGGALVGVGIPSAVEFASGRALVSCNVPLVDVPLRAELTRRTGLQVVVDNDATVAALAEACDDAGAVIVDSLVMVTVGTGIGGGLIVDGRIYRGASGAAGEPGMMIIDAGAQDEAGAAPAGSLERRAAGPVLDALAAERGYADGPACLAAAQAGEAPAIEALRIVGQRLGVGVANMICCFDPREVVIGGGLSVAGDLLLGPVVETARELLLPGFGTATTIRLAKHGPDAGVRGAALLAHVELGHATR